MKKITLTIVGMLSFFFVSAQNNSGWGLKVGLSYNINSSTKFDEGGKTFSGKKQNTGYILGAFYKTSYYEYDLYFQPEFLFSRYTNELSGLRDKTSSLIKTTNFNENNLEVNLLIGKRFAKILRVKAGPSGIWSLTNQKENDISTDFKPFRIGYQLGVGAEVGPVGLDLAYRGSFKGDNGYINLIDGHKINLDQRLSQFVITLGIQL